MARTLRFLVILTVAVCVAATDENGDGIVLPVGSALIGKRVVLNCVLNASNSSLNEPVKYEWLKEEHHNSYRFLQVTDSDALIIPKVTREDEGSYLCRKLSVNNVSKVEVDTAHLTLTVLVPPDIAIAQKAASAQRPVTEGGALILTCHVTNTARPSVPDGGYTWSFLGQKGHHVVTLRERSQDLTIQPVYRNNSGRYTCQASNGVHTILGASVPASSMVIQVYYIDQLVTLLPSEWQTAVAGEKVTLTCKADSVPTANLTWLHQGRILRTVESNKDVYSFPATDCQDSGEYQCRADNDFLKKSLLAQTKLTVTGCAPVLVKSSTSPSWVTGYVGYHVTLTVSVTAHPAPSFLWSGPGLSSPVPHTPSLTLYNLQPQQAGNYTVIVSNSHGSINHTFILEVIKKVDKEHEMETPRSGVDLNTWLQVGGGAVVALVCLVLVCLLLLRTRRFCTRGNRNGSMDDTEHQYTGLYSGDCCDSAGRRRSQEVADYTSGESTGQYWSIDSADLSWQSQAVQPQALQPQDSLSQVSEERGYDVPPPPVSVTSPGTPALRHQKHQPDCDVIPMDDVSEFRDSLRNISFKEGETEDEASSLPRRCRRGSRESDQESEDSESYLACHVVSHGLPPSSLASSSCSSTPQDDP